TSVQPAAARTASRAAPDSGARPRLVCTRTPVALITGVRVAAVGGSEAAAASATLAGLIAPERASSWARVTAALTNVAPSSSRAGTGGGPASTPSVLGTGRRGSTTAPLRRARRPSPGRRRTERRRTGIEPADDAKRRPPVLKTGGATRHPDASGGEVTRERPEPAIREEPKLAGGEAQGRDARNSLAAHGALISWIGTLANAEV